MNAIRERLQPVHWQGRCHPNAARALLDDECFEDITLTALRLIAYVSLGRRLKHVVEAR